MTAAAATPGTPATDAEARWNAWLARGVANDRRQASIMTGIAAVLAIGLGAAIVWQFL